MSLRLVGREPPKPARKKYERSPLLDAREEAKFRAAMRALHDGLGSWPCVARAMRINVHTIRFMMNGRVRVGGDMIVRAMRASGLSYDDLMGAPVLAGTCRACGAVRRAS